MADVSFSVCDPPVPARKGALQTQETPPAGSGRGFWKAEVDRPAAPYAPLTHAPSPWTDRRSKLLGAFMATYWANMGVSSSEAAGYTAKAVRGNP